MLYPFLRKLFRGVFRVGWRWKVKGLENFPMQGPVIVVSNHVSLADPIALGAALPRPIFFMAKEELFQYPVLGNICERLGAFPVRRGQADRNAIRRALELLEEGNVLGLFPEGSRSKTGELLKPQPGVAMIALKARVPVVPVACRGTERNLKKGSWFKTFEVQIGKQIEYSAYYKQRLNTKSLAIVM